MRNILSLILAVALLVTTNVHRADAVMIPQDTYSTTFSKTVYNPEASSQWNLIYSYDPSPFKVYRWCGYLRATLNSTSCAYWQIRDNNGNVLASHTYGQGTHYVDDIFSTGVDGFKIYAKTSNTSVSYCTFSSDGNLITIYYGSDVADQETVEAARDAANTASTNATNAYNAANTAATNAATASTRALNAYNSVYNSNGNTITAVRDAGGTVLDEARQAKITAETVNTKIDSLSAAVTNIQNSLGADTSPPSVEITTVSGALATSGSTIRSVVNAGDNVSTAFEYSLDGTVYQPLPADGVISLPVNSLGPNLITVWVKDEAGNTGRDSITIRKL